MALLLTDLKPNTQRRPARFFLYSGAGILVHSVLIINVELAVQMFNSQVPGNLNFQRPSSVFM